ncbi:hypothetical protein BCR33DRAFT_721296 [Rhizoclosmatium globosum]|uniref:RING-CH-type domain-containing protein n=1 Tax=Rhizoclosmatium globosum TaxID=329046 RepID=A0A1Y2BT39_9FUNG|nr:hypothetical protein BCR33DRAFT_721296 [Rhizoclosmatium globosum]|eukprot:ORY37807.1 hypothetical protein BCR33DRAFT_721296 [Rhizoclosmatium globosum]
MCRICFCSEDATEDQELFDQIGQEPPIDLGRLISPCKCKGSMKYVHLSCLNEWRKVTANSAHFQCDQCKYEYSFERTKWATFLRNSLLILTLTTVSFITLVFWSGFIAKLILRFCFHQSVIELFSLSPDDLDDDLDQLVLQVLTEPTLFDLFKINWVHWVLGISLVGLVGAMHSVAGLGIYRMTRRRIGLDNERAGGGVLLATILIGSLKALWTVFCEVKKFSIRSLDILESRILDIGDDDDPID